MHVCASVRMCMIGRPAGHNAHVQLVGLLSGGGGGGGCSLLGVFDCGSEKHYVAFSVKESIIFSTTFQFQWQC